MLVTGPRDDTARKRKHHAGAPPATPEGRSGPSTRLAAAEDPSVPLTGSQDSPATKQQRTGALRATREGHTTGRDVTGSREDTARKQNLRVPAWRVSLLREERAKHEKEERAKHELRKAEKARCCSKPRVK